MVGYRMLLDAHKKVLEEDGSGVDREFVKAEIKALEPFAERTEQEVLRMFDSGAFNEVTKAYCKLAMQNCGLDAKITNDVLSEISYLFDTVSANELMS